MKKLKNWTLQFASVLVLLGASVGLTSCDDETLSASKAKSLLKKEISRLNHDKAGIEISTGYYECNDNEARYKLRQLVANQLIYYKCERVMKPETVKKTRRVRDGWGFTYNKTYYETDTVPTYFVTVALTVKGEKLLWEEKEVKPTKDEEEMKADLELDSSKFPEGSVKEVEFPGTDAETGVTAAADVEGDGVMDDISEEDYDAMAADEKADLKGKSAYDQAKMKEEKKDVKLLAFGIKVVKVRNIQTSDEGNSAKGEALYEFADVTPVGRIMGKVVEGKRFVSPVRYVYYQDKGWTLKDYGDE